MKMRVIKNRICSYSERFSFVVLLCVFVFMSSSDLSLAHACGMSFSEYVLFVLVNHYYLTYGWFMFLIYNSVRRIRNNADIEMIRYHSYRKYYLVEIISTALHLLLLIFLHVLAAIALATVSGFPFLNIFFSQEISDYYNGNLELLFAYQEVFDAPLGAIILSMGYLLLGSTFTFAIIFFSYQLWGDTGLFLSGIYVIGSTVVGFVTEVDESIAEMFFFNNYFILHHPLVTEGTWAVLLNISIMLFAIIFGVIAIHGRRKLITRRNS